VGPNKRKLNLVLVAKHAALGTITQDWLARGVEDISKCGLMLQPDKLTNHVRILHRYFIKE